MNKKKLILIGAIAVALVIIGVLVFWNAKPAADAPTPSPEASAAGVQEENAALAFGDDQRGTATQQVAVGKNVAMVTVSFSYELQGDQRVITEIESATAENIAGWHSVEKAAAIDQDKIIYANEGAQAVVPVTYQASIGAGNVSYDDVVVIDLTAD